MYVANLSVPTEDDEDKGAGVQKTAVTSGAVKPMVSVPQPGALAGGAATNGVNPLAPVTESNLAPAAAAQIGDVEDAAAAKKLEDARKAELDAQKRASTEKARLTSEAEGEQAKALAIAKNLLAKGLDIETIAETTGLTIDAVAQLRNGG